ncbi:Uncharacterised protein [Bordetella pertussis]|nr:Uncharacterised protein [Bordetella pertussis]
MSRSGAACTWAAASAHSCCSTARRAGSPSMPKWRVNTRLTLPSMMGLRSP